MTLTFRPALGKTTAPKAVSRAGRRASEAVEVLLDVLPLTEEYAPLIGPSQVLSWIFSARDTLKRRPETLTNRIIGGCREFRTEGKTRVNTGIPRVPEVASVRYVLTLK